MKFPPKTLIPYLTGERFHEFLRIPLGYQKTVVDRRETILKIIKGKSVLHIGCCDHKPPKN